MSTLDDLFSDLQEDLEKVEKEESAVDNVLQDLPKPPTPPPASSSSTSNKKPKLMMMPTQLAKSKKEVVTSAAPTINKEYLQDMFGLAEGKGDYTARSSRPTYQQQNPAASSIRLIAPPPPPPVPTKPAELVFQSSGAQQQQPVASSTTATEESAYRLFVGNLGMEVRDDTLQKVFKDYPSVTAARAVMEPGKDVEKCRGYGFVYFSDPFEMLRAMREKNGKLCGARPMQITKAKGEQHQQDKKKTKPHGGR